MSKKPAILATYYAYHHGDEHKGRVRARFGRAGQRSQNAQGREAAAGRLQHQKETPQKDTGYSQDTFGSDRKRKQGGFWLLETEIFAQR